MCMIEHALFLSPSPVSLKSQYFPVLRAEQFLEQTLVSSLCLDVQDNFKNHPPSMLPHLQFWLSPFGCVECSVKSVACTQGHSYKELFMFCDGSLSKLG